MPFDRRNLPDPISYYESEGLKLTSRGKWRTTACQFHGGSDSMRINADSGAFATGWLLALPFLGDPAHRNGALVLIALTAVVTLRTKLAPIWMILVGALLGAAGIA